MKRINTAAMLLLVLGCSRSTPVADPASAQRAVGTVTVQIIGTTKTTSIKVPEIAQGTMLEEVMRSIKEIPVEIQGSGTTAFVDKIGDQATGSSAGWTFKVDGDFANQGIGRTPLNPPTTVTWRYGESEF